MTKEELEKYAHENRKRLDAQEVKIGDVVKVLRGQFAGETGVIVSISACRNDYTDPYYEADMNCKVPDKYKCRTTLISPNNVIGGLSATDFEVIAPKQPSMEIKQGDMVRVSKDAPRIYVGFADVSKTEFIVGIIDDGVASVHLENEEKTHAKIFVIPTKYLIKVKEEAKFKVGDKVVVHYSTGDKIGRIQEVLYDGCYDIDYGGGCTGYHIIESRLYPYTEPTAPTIKVGDFVRVLENLHEPICLDVERHLEITNMPPHAVSQKEWKVISVEMRRDCAGRIYTLKHDDSFIYNIPEDCVELVQPKEQTEAEKKPNIGSIKIPVEVDLTDSYWTAYTADLAKEIAVKLSKPNENKPGYVADYAVSVAKAVVENLNKK